MRWVLAAFLVLHGLIHFLGFARAFEVLELPQLREAIPRGMGLLWLLAGLSLLSTAVLVAVRHRWWWALGIAGVALSQVAIIASWEDAKFGTAANLLVLAASVHGLASRGPWSFEGEYLRQLRRRRLDPAPAGPVTEEDLERLPAPLQCYLRKAGAVGQPRVRHFRARWRGRIRGGPDEAWMSFTAEQHNFIAGPARFFLMRASRAGLPVDVFHSFRDGAATMRVKLLSLFSIVDAAGPDLTRAETVTLLNDLCLLAPGALVDAGVDWEPVDERRVRARYTVGSNSVSGELIFNDASELVDFVSDDRLAASADGREFVEMRWSTPVSDYRRFRPYRLFSRGQGLWHPPEGAYAYFEAELLDLQVNGPAP